MFGEHDGADPSANRKRICKHVEHLGAYVCTMGPLLKQ